MIVITTFDTFTGNDEYAGIGLLKDGQKEIIFRFEQERSRDIRCIHCRFYPVREGDFCVITGERMELDDDLVDYFLDAFYLDQDNPARCISDYCAAKDPYLEKYDGMTMNIYRVVGEELRLIASFNEQGQKIDRR